MSIIRAAATLGLLVCAAACAKAPTPAPIVEAERAFAADGYEYGVKVSFLKHSAPDAVVLAPDPVNAHESLSAQPDLDPNAPRQRLIWWPLWAGIAKSGDLGFTTGPVKVDENFLGHYFTVWKLQEDGSWKWVFDAGVGADPSAEEPQGSPAGHLPLATAASASPEAALEEVNAAEAELAAKAETALVDAYQVWLAPDARVHTEGPPPAKDGSQHAAALAARGEAVTFEYLGGGASKAGDLVWTYGDARWTGADGPRRGHYARVWQKRTEGWRLVFDELVPFRGPPPAAE